MTIPDPALPIGAFRPLLCPWCQVTYTEHPGHDKPFCFLPWLGMAICWWCDQKAYGPAQVNEIGGAVQMRMELA